MPNITKEKRDQMIAFLEQLKKQHSDDSSIRAFNEIENHLKDKKFGLVFEEHKEQVDELLEENIPILNTDSDKRICKDINKPWNFIIKGDNLQALYLLEKTHRGEIDCIYIDPPYNSGAKDWKYNNDYVDSKDVYRHSKWLSMMKNRLHIAKNLLNMDNSVLIVTIDEKEYLHLGCLLEEMFPSSNIQMVSSVINPKGSARDGFSRSDEYIFFVMNGSCSPNRLPLSSEWSSSAVVAAQDDSNSNEEGKEPSWTSMMRRGTDSLRTDCPNLYYPIYANPITKKIEVIGDSLPKELDRGDEIEGLVQILPIRQNGSQGRWQVSNIELKNRIKQGRIRLGRKTSYGFVVNYLPDGVYKDIIDGVYSIDGFANDGSLIAHRNIGYKNKLRMPPTQWKIASHNASENGTALLDSIIGEKRFSFPKSLYAVKDTLKFFISDKPNAIVLDFFAGSGTTQHAVNLINAEDNGNRTCIMVTNNEISAEEEKEFAKKGIKKGSPEWEAKGIANYETWPRTFCSINGVDINGNTLKGNYLENNIPLSSGFKTNVKFFSCEWTPRKPDDYLLSNVLCLHVKEMVELQNAIEIDNIKNVLILNKQDFKNTILNPNISGKIQNIWLNQNIIFNAEELDLLEEKGYKYIPREFFGHELKEVAE